MPVSTLTPTYDTGARSKGSTYVSLPPGRGVDDEMLRGMLPDIGMNTAFVADILSAALAHERCGRHLYRSVAARTLNPFLKSKYETYGAETERHVEILEGLITAMGGDPQYVSPAARATEGSDTKNLEATFLLGGSVDVMTAEMVMLDAVLTAESLDHANWQAIGRMAAELPPGDLADQFTRAVDEVTSEEDDHLEWARETRTKMILLQAKSQTITALAAKGEELVATVKSWFS
jgi:rubrerythrin